MLTQILIIAGIVAVILVAKFVKAAAHVLFFGGIIVFVAAVLGAALVFRDAREFKARFPAEPSTFLLLDNATVLAGFVQAPGNVTFLDRPRVAAAQAALDAEDWNLVKNDSYKLFLFQVGALDWARNYTLPGLTASAEGATVRAILLEKDPIPPLVALYTEAAKSQFGAALDAKSYKADLGAALGDAASEKGKLFNGVVAELLRGESLLSVMSSLRRRAVRVEPNSPMFRALSHLPQRMWPNETALFQEEGAGPRLQGQPAPS